MARQTFTLLSLIARSFALGLLLVLGGWPLAHSQMPTLPHDSDLLAKIRNRRFREISDTNTGRMDLYAVVWALEKADCRVPGSKNNSPVKVLDFAVKYTKYLTTDSETGAYPSKEFFTLGAIGMLGARDPGALLTTNPNSLAAAAFIDQFHCGSKEVNDFETGLFAAMDDHIEWHEKNLGAQAPESSHRVVSIAQSGLSDEGIYSLTARDAVRRQLQQAGQAQLLECNYGPTHPDSTGSEQFRFWFKTVGISTEEVLKVSAKNPLARFGDNPKELCPKKLNEASQALQASLQSARSKLDPRSLPAAEMPLDRLLSRDSLAAFNAARRNIDSYKTSHDHKQMEEAMSQKASLIGQYLRQCAALAAASPDSTFCAIRAQLDEDLNDIPDSEDLQAFRNNPTSPPAAFGGAAPRQDAEYLLAVATVDPIDLEGISSGREFHARVDRSVNYGPRTIVPAGADVYLKGSPFEPGRAIAAGMTHIQIVAAYAMSDGKRIDFICKPVLKTFRTEKFRVDRNGRTYPYPPRDYSVLPGTKFSLWVQLRAARKP